MLSTLQSQPQQQPQPQITTAPLQPKPKEFVEKPVIVSKPTPVVTSMNTLTKPMFGTEKPQMSFGMTPEKPTPSQSSVNLSINKSMSFDAPPTTSSGFSFGTKSDASSVFGSSPSTGFPFGGATTKPTPAFGLSPQIKSEAVNLPKTTVTTKQPLLVTPTSANEKPKLFTPPAPKPVTPVASGTVSSSTTVPSSQQNVSAIKTALLSTPNIPPTATSSAFKFDLGNAFTAAADKSKSDKENNPVSTAVPIAKTSSINSFSFALGASSATQSPSTKPATPATVQPSIASPLAAPSVSVATVSSTPASTLAPTSKPPSSIGFSFAQASAESSIFGGSTATTNVVTTTSSAAVSSSTDPSNVFQSFNICKPNVSDSSNCEFEL